ncbi:hypothetical protein C5167_022439 [Papaver somniferum]|uniref:Uncharacterized protein n=1 Tax=Papaver somniferum TaxID=3469 RepID=A0A4Y7JIU5_PAPSO|nr:protein SHOOT GRAVITROPISM 5-like [Papaver somniferum]RZC60687.1 hypothetical protein C5167_022439 [Papaver somniferum]
MEEEHHHYKGKELQLLPTPRPAMSSSTTTSRCVTTTATLWRSASSSSSVLDHHFNAPPSTVSSLSSSLDLQLSISLHPNRPPPQSEFMSPTFLHYPGDHTKKPTATNNQHLSFSNTIDALKWQTAEQIRLAKLEMAYAERVRELTRREMELAQSEFARARHIWQIAREDVEKAERLKERATRRVDSTCMEITCQSCRRRFLLY